MIIESMASDRRRLLWTLFHVVLGAVCTVTPFILIFWFYFIFISNIPKGISSLSKERPSFYLMLMSYLISFEVLDRMAETSPYLPYELSKYFLVFMSVLGFMYRGISSYFGIWMVILIFPAVFYDFSGYRTFQNIVFDFLGPLAVGLGIAFSDKLEINKNTLNQVLRFIFWGCIACLSFTFIRTPEFESIDFGLGALSETTGGHSSNQVSTILGLGMFLCFYSIINNLNFTGSRYLDFLVLIAFCFQGLLSFSRGGMLVAVVGCLFLFFLPSSFRLESLPRKKRGRFFAVSVTVLVLLAVFKFADNITGGNLLLRYQGQTEGTLAGSKERTADNVLSGRLGIMEKDIALWLDYPVTGVGVGVSPYLRDKLQGKVPAHVEFSRLLADHGLLGLIYIFLCLLIPIRVWRVNKGNAYRNILFTLSIIALLTTFHAAMRTFATPLLLIISSISVKD